MRYIRQVSLAWAALFLLGGCALLGIETADTFNQRIAYSYGAETAVLQQIADKTNAGLMNSTDNARFTAMAENAKDLTDSARDAMRVGDIATAEGKLELARNVLKEIDDYVRSRK